MAVDAEVEGEAVPELTDSNILYINQKAAAGTTDTFANFTLKGDNAGKTIHFFAGSATSSAAEYLGYVTEAQVYTVEVQSGVSVEVNKTETITVTITPEGYTGNVAWTVESSNAALATLTDGSKDGVTFSATTEGTYTVRATLDDGKYGEAEVTVTPKDVSVTAPEVIKVNALADEAESTAENQNGLGVALKFADLPAGFTRMIWVFADGSDGVDARRYSDPVSTNGLSGQCVFKAAFGNGTASGSITPYSVQSVDAIFTDGVDTYYTNQALDEPNYVPKNN